MTAHLSHGATSTHSSPLSIPAPRPGHTPTGYATTWLTSSADARQGLILEQLAVVFDDNQRLAAEVERLQALLRRHGIQPDGGTTRSA